MEEIKKIQNNYTTIALFKNDKEVRDHTINEEGEIVFLDENGNEILDNYDLLNIAKKSPHIEYADNRVLLGAYISDSTALSSGALNELDYNFRLDLFRNSLSVLAVECISVEYTPEKSLLKDNIYLNNYKVTFRLIDSVCQMETYDLPPQNDIIELASQYSLHNCSGEFPFEEGKTYLIRGFYKDYDIREDVKTIFSDEDTSGSFDFEWKRITGEPYILGASPRKIYLSHDVLSVQMFSKTENEYKVINKVEEFAIQPITKNNYVTWCVPENIVFPYYAEYDGDWREWLKSDDGEIWREVIIPFCEKNHSSAPVILSDNIESMYTFNNGENYIIKGREITKEEFEKGEKVCLISEDYAKLNNYKINDKITMDFYDSEYERSYAVKQGAMSGIKMNVLLLYPLSDRTKLNIEEEYTIVGIYAGTKMPLNEYSFTANTVFVPKNSLKTSCQFEDYEDPLLNTIILKNGTINDFEKYMESNGAGGYFTYYDQGYDAAKNSIKQNQKNAFLFFLISFIVFLFSVIMFVFAFKKQIMRSCLTMRCLGVDKKTIRNNLATTVLIIFLMSEILKMMLMVLWFTTLNDRVMGIASYPNLYFYFISSVAEFFIFAIANMFLIKKEGEQNWFG